MRYFFLIFFLSLTTYSCNKPKTVMICGDHVCVNKDEAKQYFEENLSLEVKVIDKKKTNELDLVELNLEKDSTDKKIFIKRKKNTNKKIKTLSQKEISKIKSVIKRNKLKNKINKDKKEETKITERSSQKENEMILKTDKLSNIRTNIVDVCTIVDKCSIEEISKYLIKEGKNKKFPDITKRE